MTMDEPSYQRLADAAMKRLEDGLGDVDPDNIDCEHAGDVMTLTFPGKKKCVVNTQRAARQIWLAANARAWHFSYDAATARWLDDKGTGAELFETVARVVKDATGVDVTWT